MAGRVRSQVCAWVLLASTAAWGNHIPGHNDNDPTFPVPFPTQEFFSGGAIAVLGIGPAPGTEILNATFDITWVSDGATPAADLDIYVSTQVDDTFKEFSFTGADLGFGSGPGTFTGTLQTTALNGIAWKGFILPTSIVDIHVQAVGGGIDGTAYFVDSFIIFDVIPVPEPTSLALVAGGALAVMRRRRIR